nr:hypothetical protein [uncultured Butyrivibrio sp.]
MFRNLYADIRSILLSRAFHLALIIIAAYQVLYFAFIKVIYLFVGVSEIDADDIAFVFVSVAAFLVTAATLFITDREFSSGCIRNKLISGVKRRDAFLSAVCGGMLQGALYTAFACLISIPFIGLFSVGFINFSIQEVADYWLIVVMTCMAIGAFSTALVMILGGSKLSYVIGLLIAFVMKVWDTVILDKLYPEKGFCKLTGAKLAVYSFVDKYIPYSYLMIRPHYEMRFYVTGCAAMIVISVVIGLIVFSKRELK